MSKDFTPAKPCSANTPAASKKEYKGFSDNYFMRLKLDETNNNIIIICYDTIELENERYEIKINKEDLNYMSKFFKMYDKIEEIYDLIYEIFVLGRYKIITNSIDEEKKNIELNFIINCNNNSIINFSISLDLKLIASGDFTSDYNYILKREIINLKKKYEKEITDLKTQNQEIMKELKEQKELIKDLLNNKDKDSKTTSGKSNPSINKDIKTLNLKGKKIGAKELKNLSLYPNLEKLNISNNNISDISTLEKCSFKELKEFNLSINKIQNIDIFKKFSFQKLNELYMDQNQISNLEPLSKIDLTHLQRLNLSFNIIEDISVFSRINAPQLKYLNLSSNKIEDISIFGNDLFKEMRELYLDNNKIDVEMYSYIIDYLKTKITKFTYV